MKGKVLGKEGQSHIYQMKATSQSAGSGSCIPDPTKIPMGSGTFQSAEPAVPLVLTPVSGVRQGFRVLDGLTDDKEGTGTALP